MPETEQKVVSVRRLHDRAELRGLLVHADAAAVCIRITSNGDSGWMVGDYTVPWTNIDYIYEEPGQ